MLHTDNDDVDGLSAINMELRGLSMSRGPMLWKILVEIDSQVTQVFIFNILRFEFLNI